MDQMSVDPVGLNCPRCEAAVPADARFCMSCGQSLAAPGDDRGERQTRLSAATPAPLVEKMLAARVSGERKPVTALFADVVGSTTLAESMDPEDWTQMMNGAFDIMSKAIFRYEGTIAQLQGDGLLAFFGAPVAHEDDPERAVRAALDMVEQIDEYARQLKAAQGLDFGIRAGINTGPVVVGNVGTDLRYEYTALGDAVNVAARVQTAAEPGSVLITANTQRFAASAFDFDDLGEIEVKGKTDRLHVFRVAGLRAKPGAKRGLHAVGLESPMVGRETQLNQLETLFGIVRAGRGRICCLIGEPGIGKSRLLSELHASLMAGAADDGAKPATWIEGRSVSYGQNLPYHLLISIVRSALGLSFTNSAAEERAAFDVRLAELLGTEGAQDVSAFLAHLLSLPLDAQEADKAKVDPETMQGRYGATVHRLLRAIAERGPTVLVCEDVHWSDPASMQVIIEMLPLVAQLPILFIGALRAERDAAGWRLVAEARRLFGEALAELQLEPLSAADSRALVGNLLAIESLPLEVREVILARAEGNPFFVEEVVRMLIEQGAIEREGERWVAQGSVTSVEIPETLHGLLLARIDQLPQEAKRSLRVAAVIGRQFPVRVLNEVLETAPPGDT
ncbi:hypothetical protein BH24CHL5_BH24CHL5_11860 [soil metagenome]